MRDANTDLRKGCLTVAARTLVVRLIAIGVVFVVGIFALAVGAAVGSATEEYWGIAAGGTVFFVAVVGGAWGFLIFSVVRRKGLMDSAFVPLGLKGQIYRMMFRRYEGEIGGRATEVYFYRGPNLEVLMTSNIRSRAGITLDYGDTASMARLFGREPVNHGVTGMEQVRVWSEDDVWVRQMLLDPRLQDDLHTLLGEREFFVRSIVKVFPGYVHLHLSGNRNVIRWAVPPELALKWVSTLGSFARHLETRIPKPAIPLERTAAEDLALRIKRKDMTRINVIVMIVFLGMLGLFAILIAAFVALVSFSR